MIEQNRDGSPQAVSGSGSQQHPATQNEPTCVYCGRPLDDEETADPYRDETGDIMCDECYSEHFEYICPLCHNLVAIDGNQEHIIVTQALAEDQKMVPGIYRITDWPWFTSNYFSMRIHLDALTREADVPAEVVDLENGDYVCEQCVSTWRKMKPGTLEQYRSDALEAAARSHLLWQSVNRAIAEVLDAAVRKRHSRQLVYSRLMKMAGPTRPSEPVSIGNIRSAAKQIADCSDRLTLI